MGSEFGQQMSKLLGDDEETIKTTEMGLMSLGRLCHFSLFLPLVVSSRCGCFISNNRMKSKLIFKTIIREQSFKMTFGGKSDCNANVPF